MNNEKIEINVPGEAPRAVQVNGARYMREWPADTQYRAEIAHLRAERDSLVAVLEQRVRDADGTISRLHSKLSRQTDAYESLQRRLLQAETDYKDARDEVKRLREQLKQDRNAIRVELLDELHKQARAKLITETPIFRG